jgi:hypothetical protein
VFYYNLGLTNSKLAEEYANKMPIAQLMGSEETNLNSNLHTKSRKSMPLELFGLLRSMGDVTVEYENGEELRKIRQTYLVHILDHILQERQRVFDNDMKEREENNRHKITLDNVFKIADHQDQAQDPAHTPSDDDEDLDEEEEAQQPDLKDTDGGNQSGMLCKTEFIETASSTEG